MKDESCFRSGLLDASHKFVRLPVDFLKAGRTAQLDRMGRNHTAEVTGQPIQILLVFRLALIREDFYAPKIPCLKRIENWSCLYY